MNDVDRPARSLRSRIPFIKVPTQNQAWAGRYSAHNTFQRLESPDWSFTSVVLVFFGGRQSCEENSERTVSPSVSSMTGR